MFKSLLRDTLLVIFVSFFILSSCDNNNYASTNQGYQSEIKSPLFKVDQIKVVPEWLFAGDNVTVYAEITNSGNAPGSYLAEFNIDGEKYQEKTVSIAENQTAVVTFVMLNNNVGYKTISIGGSQKTLYFSKKIPYEIRYDNWGEEYISIEGKGKMNAGWSYWVLDPYGQMVRYTVPAKPFIINKISIIGFLSTLSDSDKRRNFEVRIYDGIGKVLWGTNLPWELFMPGIVYIEVPNISVDDDFYVEFISHTPPINSGGFSQSGRDPYIGLAFGISDFETRSSYSKNGTPISQTPQAGVYKQFAVRVHGYGGENRVLYYDDAKADAYKELADFSSRVTFDAPSYPWDLRAIQLYGYRTTDKDVDMNSLTITIIDKGTYQCIWQKSLPLKDIQLRSIISDSTYSGNWVNYFTDNITCYGPFIIDVACNQLNGAFLIGCDTSERNRNSEMAINGEPAAWREWSNPLGAPKMTYTQSNTKWMIREVGIAK